MNSRDIEARLNAITSLRGLLGMPFFLVALVLYIAANLLCALFEAIVGYEEEG